MAEERKEGCSIPQGSSDMAPALIALHPQCHYVVVAIGAGLRIFDLTKNVSTQTKNGMEHIGHSSAIRCLKFEKDGTFLATAGDDKKVKLWKTCSFQCVKEISSSKRVSAIAFSQCSQYLMFADKFGVVYAVTTKTTEEGDRQIDQEPVQIFGHCCSIITGLECSPEMKFIVSSDRDFKIRVTVFPKNPLMGAHEINSFCLGHTNFVSCVAFLGGKGEHASLLASGGGDSTVRLWDYQTGTLYDTFDIKKLMDQCSNSDENEDVDLMNSVISMAVAPCSSILAAVIERLEGVLLITCNFEERKLVFLQKLVLEEHICPTSLQFDQDGNLWVAAGAAASADLVDHVLSPEEIASSEAKAQALCMAAFVRIIVAKNTSVDAAADHLDPRVKIPHFLPLQDKDVPGGNLLLETLQGSKANLTETMCAAEAAKLCMKNLLSKRQFTFEEREFRKCKRSDKILKGNRHNSTRPESL